MQSSNDIKTRGLYLIPTKDRIITQECIVDTNEIEDIVMSLTFEICINNNVT